ncbi:M61 family metallopeptidase [Mucilaginibacter gynuensis]|uniref:M61 family metallopeptidase n=1 Tax=Mucilaginibacter gynuensis TaxID=1302236 RepID=A0ABP8GZX1_9SPHI
MKKLLLVAVACIGTSALFAQKRSQAPVYYNVSFPNAVHHEAEIVITVPQAPAGPMRFRMSRSSPGRYATHEFGKNIYNVKAFTDKGTELPLKQIEGDVYEVAMHPSTVNISYTLFGNWVDGTYAGIDAGQAHLNMPASFMWVAGLDKRPVKFKFNGIEKYGWKVSTQLKNEGDNVYSAPNLQYMMDSPTELSNFKSASWEVVNPDGKRQKVNLHVYSDDSQQVVDNFAKMVQKVVLEEKAIYGELPNYDYGEYTFINNVHPTVNGDGMEHRNSTIITDPIDKIGGNEVDVLSTFSHEYFHSWNVERIRPKSLEPFNFEHSNVSAELWFAEGFTQYYGEMLLRRAGFHDDEAYGKVLAGLVNSVLNMPAAAKYSPAQMSRYAVFADAGVSIDANNNPNIFTSYYVYGGATALALDLRLRSEFNLTLDDYMRKVWQLYGKKERAYTIPMLQLALAQLTKEPGFASDFFKQYIYGFEKNNYVPLLANAGFAMQKAKPGAAWAGPLFNNFGRSRAGQAHSAVADSGLFIATSTVQGTPIYKAGIDAGDVILKADGKSIKTQKEFNDIVATKKPGDKIVVNYKNRTGDHQTTIVLEENPYFEVVPFEKAGKTLTADQEAFRNNWLQSKVK